MQLTSLVAAAGLAVASTNALLLPPDVDVDEDVFSILPHPAGNDNGLPALVLGEEVSHIKLNCPGCPLLNQHRNGHVSTHTKIPSHLELDFSIDSVDGQDALMVNGYPLFPSSLAPLEQPLIAKLVPDFRKPNPSFVHYKAQEGEKLGYAMMAGPVAAAAEDKMDLLSIDFQVMEVGTTLINGIPKVEIMLIHTPDNKLMIASVGTVESEERAPPAKQQQQQCTSLLCQAKNMFKGVFSGFGNFKPCAGRPRPHRPHRPESASSEIGDIVGDADEGMREPMDVEEPPRPGHHHGHHGPHGHGHGHGFGGHGRKHHSWGRLLSNIASQILFPIAFGVFMGVTASAIGMMVGTLIVHVWRTCVRGGRRGQCERTHESVHKAPADDVVVEEEKAGLMAHQEENIDAPPAYETPARHE